MSFGQDLGGALVHVMTAQTAMTQYQAAVQGSVEGWITNPAANADGFIGFLLNDVTASGTVAVRMMGGIAKAIAGASISSGSLLIIEGSDGRLQNFAATNTNRNYVASALRDGVDGDVVPVLIVRGVGNLP